MKRLLVMIVSLAFAACSRIDQQSETNKTDIIQPRYSNSVVKSFSDESDKDTLLVMIMGETLVTGRVYLKITDHTGNVIFWDDFPATVLIDHEGLIDPENDEKHISGLSYQKSFCQAASDPSSTVSGRYQVTHMTVSTSDKAPQELIMNKPGDHMSAIITVKRKSSQTLTLSFTQYQDTTQQLSFLYGDAYMRPAPKGYDLYQSGRKMATINGKTLTIDISATEKETGIIRHSLIESTKKE